jgi:allantoin racemase
MMLGAAEPFLPSGWTLRGCQAARGVAMITDDSGLPVAAEEVVRIGLLEASCVDAIVVAAFADPGASALRALVSIPVVGIGEAALREAGAGGRRFGVATTTPGLVASIEARVRSLGLSAGFTGVRVPPGDPLSLAASPADQDAALADSVHACLHQDGASTVVIGGGPLSATAARLTERFGAAIVQPLPAAIRAIATMSPSPPTAC